MYRQYFRANIFDSLSDVANLSQRTLFHLCIEDIEDVNAREERISVLYFLPQLEYWGQRLDQQFETVCRVIVRFDLHIDNCLASRHEWFTHDSTWYFIMVIRHFFLTVGFFSEKILETITFASIASAEKCSLINGTYLR